MSTTSSTNKPPKRSSPVIRKKTAAARQQTKLPAPAETVETKYPRGASLLKRVRGGYTPDAKLALRTSRPALPTAWQITRTSISMLLSAKKLYFGIAAVYLVLSVLLVKGATIGANSNSLKQAVSTDSGVGTGFLAYALLLSGSGNGSNQVSGVYQILLAVVVSLAFIWTFRQTLTSSTLPRIRDGFYRGMYPIIPVLLVLLVIGLQLIPMVLGTGLYSLVVSSGIASTLIERTFWGLAAGLLAAISVYLTISSLFAVYIAALPDVVPMQALRSARELVRFRRWIVLRKLLFLPAILTVVSMIIMIPLLLTLTGLASYVFFVLSILGLPVVHAYMYTLYRELLK